MSLSTEELGRLYPIILETYNPLWPHYFLKEKETLLKILGNSLVQRIEHIGSTAIEGMKAKPTVDILVAIPDGNKNSATVTYILQTSGYIKMEEQKKHLMFVKGYTPEGLDKESFHIHIGPQTSGWLWDRVYFRDYLIHNPVIAKEYETLKIKLAHLYKNDRDKYTDSKESFVTRITELAKNEALHRKNGKE